MNQRKSSLKNVSDKSKSIQTAIKLLNEIVENSRDDIRDFLEKDYDQLKEALSIIQPEIKAALKKVGDNTLQDLLEAKDSIEKKGKEAFQALDESVKSHPWMMIGFSSIFFIIIGFLLGRKEK